MSWTSGTPSKDSTTFSKVTADEAPSLDGLAREFADKLTSLTRGVLGQDSPQFHAVNEGNKLRVSPIREDEVIRRIPVKIGGKTHLSLVVRYYCCWDGSSTFLATDRADVHVHYGKVADPLIRFEYVRGSENPPGAHIHMHAHRDEIAYLLRLSEAGPPKTKLRKGMVPRLHEMHLPVGGHRMRPSLEDALLFLKREFNIDTAPDWRNVLDESQREWRTVQMKSAARDNPEAAAEVLRDLGYTVEAPKVGRQQSAPGRVKLYWP